MNRIIAIALFTLTSCQETQEAETELAPEEKKALEEFQETGTKAKEVYKIEVKRTKMDFNEPPKEQKEKQ